MAPTPPPASHRPRLSLFTFLQHQNAPAPNIAPEGRGVCFRLMQTLSTLLAFLAGAALVALMPSVTPRSENGNGLDNWQRSIRGQSAKSLVERTRGLA
jgi:hypothetical protein